MNSNSNQLDIPIVIFMFKRVKKTVEIISQVAKVHPKRIYLIADQGRNDAERHEAELCRSEAEAAITWDCEVVKYYADVNRGVFDNIGNGAKWVFEREDVAIFLEDDNLPELSFFSYCEELLRKYYSDSRVLWICGSNYMKKTMIPDGSDYFFSQNMLPCGWASWSNKFNKYYDSNFEGFRDKVIAKELKNSYLDLKLYKQDVNNWKDEIERIDHFGKPSSWDYQMSLSMRRHGVYAIIPKFNQIRNIGVDEESTHGGDSMNHIMTKRFCDLETHHLDVPLKHPTSLVLFKDLELRLADIITYPFRMRMKVALARKVRRILGIGCDESISNYLKNVFRI